MQLLSELVSLFVEQFERFASDGAAVFGDSEFRWVERQEVVDRACAEYEASAIVCEGESFGCLVGVLLIDGIVDILFVFVEELFACVLQCDESSIDGDKVSVDGCSFVVCLVGEDGLVELGFEFVDDVVVGLFVLCQSDGV